ncbi:MAG: DoxX family protein [bacterium]
MNILNDIALTSLRMGSAAMLLYFHGWKKLVGCFNYIIHAEPWAFIDTVEKLGFPIPGFLAVMAALTESIGALFLLLGLYTRWIAPVITIMMLVAVYRHLTSDMRFEMAALYFLVALLFAFVGGGKWSVDALLQRQQP